MDDDFVKQLREQERILGEMRSNVHRWMDELLRQAFNPESFLRLAASMGMGPFRTPNPVGEQDGFNCYRILGLEKTATDEAVKKRYRQFLMKFHPDTAETPGTDRLLQIITEAYQQIAIERGWH